MLEKRARRAGAENGMDMETAGHGEMESARRVAHRRDLTYQFPVYRWLAWLVVGGYVAGLGLMYLLAGMFGLPASLTWAALVVLFCAGIALLERPKALLTAMMFYFLLMPGNRLFGLLGLPLPGFLDELFFVPFLAVIVMSCIQRSEVPAGRWFPFAFVAVAALSWYVNGKPAPFGAVRVTLVMLKFWIIWYYCRLTCVFQDMAHFWKWGKGYIYYAAVQFLYNCLWHRRPWPTMHWDHSGGVFGPDGTGAAHFVGYISILALFLLAAWFASEGRKAGRRQKLWMAFLGVVIAYDLVIMTDTKHALFMMPVAFAFVLFHRSVPAKLRMELLVGVGIVTAAALAYILMIGSSLQPSRYWRVMMDSPKGEAFIAVTKDFSFLVPYPILGAAPGRFFSPQASESFAPLARRYVIPYRDETKRWALTHVNQTRTGGGSLLASPVADGLVLMGEFGWLGTLVYAGFMAWVVVGLLKKANRVSPESGEGLIYLSIAAGVVFLCMTMLFAMTCTVQPVMFPWWMIVGRLWDMPLRKDEPVEKPDELLPDVHPPLLEKPVGSI